MKNVKRLVVLAVAVVIVGGAAGVVILKRQPDRGLATPAGKVVEADLAQARSQAHSGAAPAIPEAVPQPATSPPEKPQQLDPVRASGQTKSSLQTPAAQTTQGAPARKEPLKDPLARVALAWVGADAEAEAYWYGAINDPSLPANERQDLIEDLNEDGLSDPKHPTLEDLPLIVSRLIIIEQAGPNAMDQVNADAFLEAYKDLINLANLATGGGEPVR